MSGLGVVYGPDGWFILTYYCDRCAVPVMITNDRPKTKAFYDWKYTHDGREFCFTCQAEWDARFVRLQC